MTCYTTAIESTIDIALQSVVDRCDHLSALKTRGRPKPAIPGTNILNFTYAPCVLQLLQPPVRARPRPSFEEVVSSSTYHLYPLSHKRDMGRRSVAIDVEVQPLPHLPSTRPGEGSSSAGQQQDVAYATNIVFDKLVNSLAEHADSEHSIYIAIQWPDERRIAGKGKSRSLVIQVRRPPDDLVRRSLSCMLMVNQLIFQRHDPRSELLYVPLQLLPRYPDVLLRAAIRLHNPVALSQMILQQLSDDKDTVSEMNDLDLGSLISRESLREAEWKSRPNGLMNGNGHHTPNPYRILREGHNILLSTTSDGHPVPFRILMLEPVAQGYLVPNTKVILSTIPYAPDQDNDDDVEGSIYGQSSHGKTHISMAEFDPDTFLSSSLALALHSSSINGEDVDGDVEQSVSSTSGSITPRPPGAVFRPTSPPARPLDLDDLDEMDADAAGTRFGAVVAKGPTGKQDDVCWVSVGGLGRAGIFEGDWVSFPS